MAQALQPHPGRDLAGVQHPPLRLRACACGGVPVPCVMFGVRARQPRPWRLLADWVLGMQAHLPDGTSIFLEQVLHHPPVSAFQLIGPGTPGSKPLTRGPCGQVYTHDVTWSCPA